jgi:Fe-S oxidoreductase/FAD/FMN-containing dehydrogenase
MTIDHVLEIDLALATGEVLHLSEFDAVQLSTKAKQLDREGIIYRGIRDLVLENADEIRQRFPKVIRRSGGYPLDALVDANPCNLAKLICGSEGTLGVILEARLRLTPLPLYSAVCLAHFDTLDSCLRASASIVTQNPSAVELIDGVILRQARTHPLTRNVCKLLQGEPEAILIIEVQGDNLDRTTAHIKSIADSLLDTAYSMPVMTESKAIQAVWQLRSSALGLMTNIQGVKKPVPYIEDAAVPPEYLADYVAEVLAICSKYNQPVSMFGHASVGLMHIRPLHDLHQTTEISRMKQIQEDVFPLVKKYNGSWSGEHGDGIVRGGFNKRFFGERLYNVFKEVKRLFDPEGRMNPGKVIETPPVDSYLRYGQNYVPIAIDTAFNFNAQGGILGAAEQCSGVGACRKTTAGVMCPSYMATRDEVHSTRGRANALRLALTGQLDKKGLGSDALKSTMDLCLSCKGCKGECPNSVDMAKLKAEVLYQHYKHHGVSLRAKFFSNQALFASLASGPLATLINGLLALKPIRWMLQMMLDIDFKRPLPQFAKQPLSTWFGERSFEDHSDSTKKSIILFNDTFTENYLPEVGIAAIEVLEAAGYKVELATLGDSQRSAISQGLLDQAKRNGHRIFQRLDNDFSPNIPIILCEPSCASALKDDLPELLDDVDLANRISKRIKMFDHFLEQELAANKCFLPWKQHSNESNQEQAFLVHNHCHEKTLNGGSWSHRLLARISNSKVYDTEAGCCGMAGSFGYELEHASISYAIAEQRLLPRLSKANPATFIVTNGFSCRHQIADLSGLKPRHIAQVLRSYL